MQAGSSVRRRQSSADGCLPELCEAARCGDGEVQAEVEDCDDGNNATTTAAPLPAKRGSVRVHQPRLHRGQQSQDGPSASSVATPTTGQPGRRQPSLLGGRWGSDLDRTRRRDLPHRGVGPKGRNHSGREGGLGARMRGDFTLSAGERLQLVVGQKGIALTLGNSANGGSGGGGGTFVRHGSQSTADRRRRWRQVGSAQRRRRLAAPGTTSTSGLRRKTERGHQRGDAPNGGGRGWNTVRNNATGDAHEHLRR